MKKRISILLLIFVMAVSAVGWFYVVYAGNEKESESGLSIFFNPQMRRFVQIMKIIDESYYRDVSEEEMVNSAIKGMLKDLDPHSVYIHKDNDLENFNMSTSGKFGGIGFRVGIRDDMITVISPIENTPASRAGIRAGDIIMKIDTVSAQGMDINEAVSLMRGEPGTDVRLKINRFGDTINFNIERAIINIKPIPYYGMIDDSTGYIKVLQFSDNLSGEFADAMDELFYKNNATSLILDLRSNPGGLLNEAINISDFFLPKGLEVVSTQSRNEAMEMSFKATKPIYRGFFSLVILVDRGSASASEIVAGAVQDWDRGIVMGDTTYGKGSVQSVYDFEKYGEDMKGILKFTTARYFTPSGRSIDRELIKYEDADPDTIHYQSLGGLERSLSGNGGIIPDYVFQERRITPVEIKMLQEQTAFVFAAKYIDNRKPDSEFAFSIPEDVIDQYFDYVREQDIDIDTLLSDSELKADAVLRLKLEFARQLGGDELFYRIMTQENYLIQKSRQLLRNASDTETMLQRIEEMTNN